MDAGDIAISGSAVLGALALLLHAWRLSTPRLASALERYAEAHRKRAKAEEERAIAERMTRRQVEAFYEKTERRCDELEVQLAEERSCRLIERGRLSELEHLSATQALTIADLRLTIAELRKRLEESERRAKAAVDARAQVLRDLDAAGGSDDRALPTPHAPEHGHDDTGKHRAVK
jgi:uncharacterized coiled-coil protein SlyX